MSRRIAALKPQLNRIRAWAHEGSTDAWIAHQLETSADAVRAFRQEHGIERGGPAPLAPITPDSVVEAMLAEEAAALEAGPEPESDAGGQAVDVPAPAPRRRTRKRPTGDDAVEGPEVAGLDTSGEAAAEPAADAPAKPSRRRTPRGGSKAAAAEATESETETTPVASEDEGEDGGASEDIALEAPAGEEPARSGRKRGRRRGRGRGGSRGLEARLLPGSVLLLDPAVTADATFQEHWRDAGSLRVEVSSDAIVLRRVAGEAEPEGAR